MPRADFSRSTAATAACGLPPERPSPMSDTWLPAIRLPFARPDDACYLSAPCPDPPLQSSAVPHWPLYFRIHIGEPHEQATAIDGTGRLQRRSAGRGAAGACTAAGAGSQPDRANPDTTSLPG